MASRPADLLSLPGEVLYLVFEQLPLSDTISLRTSRLPFLQLYLRYEQQLRRKKQEKILHRIQEHLDEWIRRYPWREHRSHTMILPAPRWKIVDDQKSSFTLRIMERMPYILHSAVYGRYACRDWQLEARFPYAVTRESGISRDWQVAEELGLDRRYVIDLNGSAKVILDSKACRVYWLHPDKDLYMVSEMEEFLKPRYYASQWNAMAAEVVRRVVRVQGGWQFEK